MLQIRLKKEPSSEGGFGLNPLPLDTVTVACPDHLVLAELPVAKGLGSATAASLIKTVGRRSRRQLGERVHFCVRCDFPIATYGRLSPCDHAFCLDCARSDSICYLCDERIQKIQTIKMMEGIFICAAPHCLKSFLKKNEFESHVHNTHANLLHSKAEKEDGNESEAISAKQSTPSESTARAPPKSNLSPNSISHFQNHEDKSQNSQPRDPQQPPRQMIQPRPPSPPFFGQIENYPSDKFHIGNNFPESGLPLEKQQGNISETPLANFPPNMLAYQMPNFPVPFQPFGFPPFPPEGPLPFYGAPFGMAQSDSALDIKSEGASLLGFPPGFAAAGNFPDIFPQPSAGSSMEPTKDGTVIFQGDFKGNQ